MTHQTNISIIDYGMGNTHSLMNSLRAIGFSNITLTFSEQEIAESDCIILPGVGAFGDAMKNLASRGLISILEEQVIKKKKPILGICLGMQLLFDSSNELGKNKGLGWIPGNIEKMEPGKGRRIPHVGWNNLKFTNSSNLLDNITPENDFYFVHSFYANCRDEYIVAKFYYGQDFTAIVQRDNIFGMQFHPEKSHLNGLQLLKTFIEMSV
tara:strand:- start:31 stop:660 length:630 start_codon:yes stop_codon:yes gene_type:complete